MVNPLDILPILALALAIACLPLLSDGPPGREQSSRKRFPEPDFETNDENVDREFLNRPRGLGDRSCHARHAQASRELP
jgi:hypothetical protein